MIAGRLAGWLSLYWVFVYDFMVSVRVWLYLFVCTCLNLQKCLCAGGAPLYRLRFFSFFLSNWNYCLIIFSFWICEHCLHIILANFDTLFICGCHREQSHRVFYFSTWIFNRKFTVFLKLFWAKNQNKENPIKISSRWLTFGTIPIVSVKLGST